MLVVVAARRTDLVSRRGRTTGFCTPASRPQDAREIAASGPTAAQPCPSISPPTERRSGCPSEAPRQGAAGDDGEGRPEERAHGFELFDKPNWMGSEFDEKVNYQRALEGELEHTIGTLAAVQSARVHLVLPHDSLFTTEQRDAKASVALQLRHRTIRGEEAEGIRIW